MPAFNGRVQGGFSLREERNRLKMAQTFRKIEILKTIDSQLRVQKLATLRGGAVVAKITVPRYSNIIKLLIRILLRLNIFLRF